jgi:diguanylate cyclase (GGDEF)-like protein
MIFAWLRQALLKDRTTVSSQADACYRALVAAAGGAAVLAFLMLLSLASGLGGLAVLLAVLLLIDAVATGVLVVFTRRVVHDAVLVPLTEMAATARQVAGGNLGAVTQPYGLLEWQQLASAIGGLAGSLERERSSRVADRTADQHQAMTLRQLLGIIQGVGATLEVDDVAARLAQGMLAVGGFRRGVVWVPDEHEPRLLPLCHVGDGDAPVPAPAGDGPLGRAMSTGTTVPIRAGRDSGVVVPLSRGLSIVGAVELRGEDHTLSAEELEGLETLAGFGTSAIEAARLHGEVELRSETDGLTKVFNRRKLDVDLKAEVARSLRYQRPLSLIMVDVDHFKAINDTFGHQQGDEVLKAVAAIIARRSRETDSAYRYGGEEFAVLLRETDGHAAAEIAERLRNRIREGLSTLGLKREITASLGVSTISASVQAPEQLVEAADGALYKAKTGGRNRVVMSGAA